jgi:hypothetical protein
VCQLQDFKCGNKFPSWISRTFDVLPILLVHGHCVILGWIIGIGLPGLFFSRVYYRYPLFLVTQEPVGHNMRERKNPIAHPGGPMGISCSCSSHGGCGVWI